MKLESDSASDAYTDRNLAVQALARAAIALGLRVGVKDRHTDWPILFIDLPHGQVSYHIPKAELVEGLPDYADEWDKHGLADKRYRVKLFAQGHARPTIIDCEGVNLDGCEGNGKVELYAKPQAGCVYFCRPCAKAAGPGALS